VFIAISEHTKQFTDVLSDNIKNPVGDDNPKKKQPAFYSNEICPV
jgi:hypothetical protein